MNLEDLSPFTFHGWRNWPIAEGKIERSVTVSGNGRSQSWVCNVLYAFDVDMRTYSGETAIACDDEEAAEYQCSLWPAGKSVIVFYRADNPSVNRTAIDE